MYSFQAKTGLKKMRKVENKNYRSVSFLLDAKLKIPKNQQQNWKKLKFTIIASFKAKIGWKMPIKRKK